MKKCTLLFLLGFACLTSWANNSNDDVFKKLDEALSKKELYVKFKEDKIARLKSSLASRASIEQEYHYNKSLFTAYRKFNTDSAYKYIRRNSNLSGLNSAHIAETKLQLANLYSSTGKYREAESILKAIDVKKESRELKAYYYEVYREFYEHYNANSNSKILEVQIAKYRDSLSEALERNTLAFTINEIQKNIYLKKFKESERELQKILLKTTVESSEYPMITYLLALVSRAQGRREAEKRYFAMSANADIRQAIKDNASLQELASIYFRDDNVDMAYKLTQSAIEDALYCNIQFRMLMMSQIYSIINTKYHEKEVEQKWQFKRYLLCISVLAVLLIIAVIFVNFQKIRLSKIKTKLTLSTKEMAKLNEHITRANGVLEQRNAQLIESNKIKEEYIAHFFSLCSKYIKKLENYRLVLSKKANAKQFEEIALILKSTDLVENEFKDLYINFDQVFLKLYPDFVAEFNKLLVPEEQIILKTGELLNTELRIFALIRLGISDSDKIAVFLRYSLSTIYNYRTRARNKTAIARDLFEENVLQIGGK